ncbi:homoprotocatechuate degradation operon regulator HpaR [Shimia sp. R11_0]|nr:homoprotocatechuate degradation operon regulator HpaR [Shimia sp. R11_0]MBO9478934.1 homoprotocatechuate degradation operon regulator HpaR [Shimia sp. R11_0]
MTGKINIPSTTQSLPIALLRARERVMKPARALLSDAGVTEQQWRVVRVLVEEGPLDPTTIAERAVLLLPSLTRILHKLDEKGYVTRQRDEQDGRRQVIRATDAGRELIAVNMPAARGYAQQLREHLGDDRYDQLLELLDDLNQIEF